MKPVYVLCFITALSACGDRTAVFVTSTSIGINAETTPPNISFAYDRQEGFYGPTDEGGVTPPVVARIASNQSVTDPKVEQLYATGEAALDVTVDASQVEARRKAVSQSSTISGNRRVAFFGTTHTTGLKVAFNPTNGFDSLILGYKRKEASYLPLVEDAAGKAQYPSTLATLTLNSEIGGLSDTDLGVGQFFATGDAARNLALNDEVRAQFIGVAAESVREVAAIPPNRDDLSECISAWARENRDQTRGWLSAKGLKLLDVTQGPRANREEFIKDNNLQC